MGSRMLHGKKENKEITLLLYCNILRQGQKNITAEEGDTNQITCNTSNDYVLLIDS